MDEKFTRKTGDFMKIKEDFVLRKVADSYVVVPVNKLTLVLTELSTSMKRVHSFLKSSKTIVKRLICLKQCLMSMK